jgi:hypothetical protein
MAYKQSPAIIPSSYDIDVPSKALSNEPKISFNVAKLFLPHWMEKMTKYLITGAFHPLKE